MTLKKSQKPHNFWPKVIVLIIFYVVMTINRAHAGLQGAQLHTIFGMTSGSYSYVSNKVNFSIMNTINIEAEIFLDSKKSFFVKFVQAYDLTESLLRYYAAYVGTKLYVFSSGKIFTKTDGKTLVVSTPRWRFYVGWDLGVGSLLLDKRGVAVILYGTALEIGANVGAIWQTWKTFGLEATGGMSYGLSLSSYSFSGTNIRLYAGGVYYFD
ncbi:MAG: hypothetical protein ISR65_10435 [Bacteriovoracaceae bacterium]|nr:hypothetical protein [Bacteriovoracaceae bacterium]